MRNRVGRASPAGHSHGTEPKAHESNTASLPNSTLVQWLSFALPVLKCAVCPACLSIFGGALAGARLGFLADEGAHAAILFGAVALDIVILGAAARHHNSPWPLALCVSGAVVALLGHFTNELIEYAGLALILTAALHNLVLMRRHRAHGGSCCAHDHGSDARASVA